MAVNIGITITQNSQNVNNNTSNVTVTLKCNWTGGSFNTLSPSGWLNINGIQYNFTQSFNTGRTNTGSQTLYTKTLDVQHNTDGTKTLSCSASFATGVSSGTVTSTASMTLSTIVVKSTLTVSAGELGVPNTIIVTRQSSRYTHTIVATCSSSERYDIMSQVIVTESSSTSIIHTIPVEWAIQNTKGTYVSIRYTITTYDGNNNLGSNSYVTQFHIPSNVIPTCTIRITDVSGHIAKYGTYIKGKSKIGINIDGTSIYGASIVSYSSKVNDSTYTTSSYTTDFLNSSGTVSITGKITDTRGRSGTSTENITVSNYDKPSITLLKVNRCNSFGVENPKGEYVKVTFNCLVSSLNSNNSALYKLSYKKTSESSYINVSLSSYEDVFNLIGGTYIFQADTGSSYDVSLEVEDDFEKSNRATSVSTAFTLMHWNSDGTSMAIGKVSEVSDSFEVALKAIFENGLDLNGRDMLKTRVLYGYERIQSGSDLDDYTIAGTYYVQNYSDAVNITNIPITTNGGLLVVEYLGNGTSDIKQTFYPKQSDCRMYQRYYDTYWHTWRTRNAETDYISGYSTSSSDLYLTLHGGIKVVVGQFNIQFANYVTSATVTFPISFNSKPYVITSQPFNSNNIVVNTDDITVDNFIARLSGNFSSTGTRTVSYIAIGV